MEEGRGQSDLLAHTGRVVDDEFVLGAREVEDVEELGGPFVDLDAGQAAQSARVAEEFTSGEPLEEPESLGQYADPGLHRHRVLPHVVADDLDGALVGAEQPGDHGQGGGLPGPVRPDEADEPARGQFQIDSRDGDLLPEPLPEPPHAYGGHIHHCSLSHVGTLRASVPPQGRVAGTSCGFAKRARQAPTTRSVRTCPYLSVPACTCPYGSIQSRTVSYRSMRICVRGGPQGYRSRPHAYARGEINSSASGSQRFAGVGRQAHWTAPREP